MNSEAEAETETRPDYAWSPRVFLWIIGLILAAGGLLFYITNYRLPNSPKWLENIALVGTPTGILLSLAILYYQRRLDNQSRRQQENTIERIASNQTDILEEATRKITKRQTEDLKRVAQEAAYEAGAALNDIELPDALDLIKERINEDHLQRLFFVSRFSVVPLFWHDKEKAKDYVNVWGRAHEEVDLYFMGPIDRKVQEYCHEIAENVINHLSLEKSVAYWHEEAISDFNSLEDVSEDASKINRYISSFKKVVMEDYKEFKRRMDRNEEIIMVHEELENLPKVNTVIMDLDDSSPAKYSYEMIMFADADYVESKLKQDEAEPVDLILDEPDLYRCRNKHVIMPYFDRATNVIGR